MNFKNEVIEIQNLVILKHKIVKGITAIQNEHDEIAEYLIEKGANKEIEADSYNETPLAKRLF